RRVIEIDATADDVLAQVLRQGRRVHLEPDAERCGGTDAAADAAEARAFDGLMQLQCVAPEMLVAESVEAERLAAAREQIARMGSNRPVECAIAVAGIA